MAETTNYKLYVIPRGDTSVDVIDWVERISGSIDGSNFVVIDNLLYNLDQKKMNQVVESSVAPEGLITGDEWDKNLE